MVLVESIGSNRLKENGAKFAQIGPIYTPKNSCEDMKLVSQKEMEHQFLRLGFRSGKQLHDEETRNSN